jgi:hypothetical protein
MINNNKMDPNKMDNHQHNNHQQHRPRQQLKEGLEMGDLARLVHDEIHVDEYKSKMGEDADIVVITFKVKGKDPATDLVNYVEKGYDWILDADTSAGEMDDGDYIVFIELERSPALVDNLLQMLEELEGLTEIEMDHWRIFYQKNSTGHGADKRELAALIPTSPAEYKQKYGRQDQEEIDQLKTAAGVPVTTTAPKNDFTESLRIAAGIR